MWKVNLKGSPFFPNGHEIVVKEKPTEEVLKDTMRKLMFTSYEITEIMEEE